ncbi:MAG: hypothetical protein ACREC4_00855 [Methylocella sp.]
MTKSQQIALAFKLLAEAHFHDPAQLERARTTTNLSDSDKLRLCLAWMYLLHPPARQEVDAKFSAEVDFQRAAHAAPELLS